MLIADSQAHIWELDRPGRRWPSGRYVPSWALTPFSSEALLSEMDTAGVDRAILVPPAFEGDRNDLSLDAAREHPDRLAVMGRLALDAPESRTILPEFKRNPGALGLRFTFFIPQQLAWLEDGTADWLWPAAEAADIPLMLLPLPGSLGKISEIAARHPGLRLTIDHLAIRHDDSNRDDDAFAHVPELVKLASHPNVAVKASGLPEYSTDSYPYRNVHRYIEMVVDAFGPQRVFWGSDLTRLPCTYREAVTMFTQELTFLSEEDKEWIMGRGLCEWLGWPLPAPDSTAN